jgi:signal transduction histidine kinase
VLGNPQHLRQVLNNLIDNAVKYTPAGGEVVVELAVDDGGQVVKLSVRDTGHGISTDEQRLIFDRFYRAESARTRLGASRGAGLGLSICQSVVHNQGGTIECASQPGQGATFTVLLPLHPR